VAAALVALVAAREAPAVLGGEAAPGDAAVVLVLDHEAGRLCTGALVAPDTVLTAAHCLETPDPGAYLVAAGPQPLVEPLWTREARRVARHPDHDPASGAHDSGVLRLATPAPTAPLPWLAQDPGGVYRVGTPFRMVGFGVASGSAGAGLRRTADLVIDTFTARLFSNDQTPGVGPCDGDDGGPALVTLGGVETVIGVFSFGDPACEQFGFWQRTDADADFLATEVPEPPAAGSSLAAMAALAALARSGRRAGAAPRRAATVSAPAPVP
jgi:secreted trypsin-like serine protease